MTLNLPSCEVCGGKEAPLVLFRNGRVKAVAGESPEIAAVEHFSSLSQSERFQNMLLVISPVDCGWAPHLCGLDGVSWGCVQLVL